MTEYMMTLRQADGGDGVGPVRYLTFDDAAAPDREMAQLDWARQVLASFPAAPAGSTGVRARSGDILFLAHGFNVSHQAAKDFHVKCAGALRLAGWQGLMISYDWPSDGLVFAYLLDRANARAAASALVTGGIALLEQFQRQDCTVNLHVLAHSMGCFVVQQAFTWSYQDVPQSWTVGQVLLVAADVDATVFSESNASAQAFAEHSGRLTAYTNRYDKALMVSDVKRLDLVPRMGRVGLPEDAPPMMCEVDCSPLFERIYPDLGSELDPVKTHCFYFDRPEFWRDAVLTLAGGIDRGVFPTRAPAANGLANRFILDPGANQPAFAKALTMAARSPAIRPPAASRRAPRRGPAKSPAGR